MAEIITTHISNPLGTMLVGVIGDQVCFLEFTNRRGFEAEMVSIQKKLDATMVEGVHPLHKKVEQQMAEYFEGKSTVFELPILMIGTEFEKSVWRALQHIPYGETRTYLQIAKAIGNPRAVRAVGRANGQNKICIAIPCHRVVGSDGSLTGYASGLERKKYLLDFEKKTRR